MSKEIHLITTPGCSACKLQEYLLEDVIENHPDIELKIYDHFDAPEWIKVNVLFNDFPVTVLIKDNVIKYHFTGTKKVRAISQLIEDVKF